MLHRGTVSSSTSLRTLLAAQAMSDCVRVSQCFCLFRRSIGQQIERDGVCTVFRHYILYITNAWCSKNSCQIPELLPGVPSSLMDVFSLYQGRIADFFAKEDDSHGNPEMVPGHPVVTRET